jgi:hypothetical protein
MACVLGVSLLMTACGDDGNDSGDTLAGATTTGSTTQGDELPPCGSGGHVVIFSVFGTLTDGDSDELDRWIDDPDAPPEARSGAAELARTYRDLGYDIVYVTTHPQTTEIDGQRLDEALTVWLGSNNFPIRNGTEIWSWPEDRDISVALIQDLALMTNSGVEIGAAYASDPDVVFPLSTSGIPATDLFTVGAAAEVGTATSLPDEDMGAHLSDIEDLAPVCE